jgi:hypothetical protein
MQAARRTRRPPPPPQPLRPLVHGPHPCHESPAPRRALCEHQNRLTEPVERAMRRSSGRMTSSRCSSATMPSTRLPRPLSQSTTPPPPRPAHRLLRPPQPRVRPRDLLPPLTRPTPAEAQIFAQLARQPPGRPRHTRRLAPFRSFVAAPQPAAKTAAAGGPGSWRRHRLSFPRRAVERGESKRPALWSSPEAQEVAPGALPAPPPGRCSRDRPAPPRPSPRVASHHLYARTRRRLTTQTPAISMRARRPLWRQSQQW